MAIESRLYGGKGELFFRSDTPRAWYPQSLDLDYTSYEEEVEGERERRKASRRHKKNAGQMRRVKLAQAKMAKAARVTPNPMKNSAPSEAARRFGGGRFGSNASSAGRIR